MFFDAKFLFFGDSLLAVLHVCALKRSQVEGIPLAPDVCTFEHHMYNQTNLCVCEHFSQDEHSIQSKNDTCKI